MERRGKGIFLRLDEEDKKLLETIARFYGIAEADVLRIALKEYAKTRGFEVSS
jgi:antitoxin component of RelBE/YafQ-DinJ toxin-antitoxin module